MVSPRTPTARRRGMLPSRKLALAVVGVLFFGGGVVTARHAWNQHRADQIAAAQRAAELARSCGPGLVFEGPQHECVGVTDGTAPPFFPAMAGIEGRFAAENRWVERSGRKSVSIAVLLPMSPSSKVGKDPAVIRSLMGIFTEQCRANGAEGNEPCGASASAPGSSPAAGGGAPATSGHEPLIRVLLANNGTDGAQWESVVPELIRRATAGDLVAVVGLGQSVEATRLQVARLDEAGVPMVGAVITADQITGAQYRSLARVALTNSGEAQALVRYGESLPRRAGDGPSMVIADNREGEWYANSLRDGFVRQLGDPRPEEYDPELPSPFRMKVGQVCAARPHVVYFAGRADDLRDFVAQMRGRCPRMPPLRVVTGDDATHLDGAAGDPDYVAVLRSGVTVDYAALATPLSWVGPQPDRVRAFLEAYDRAGFDRKDLADGQAIMHYDATLTAVEAIRNVTTSRAANPSLKEVVAQFGELHCAHQVEGASGIISLSPERNPERKRVPILRLLPGRMSTYITSVAGPAGRPCPAEEAGGAGGN